MLIIINATIIFSKLINQSLSLGASSKPGLITKIEFMNGMKSLRKDSTAGLLEILPSFDPGFLDRSEFRG